MNKEKIYACIAKHQPKLEVETSPSAAVLVIFLYHETDDMEIVLTKRTSNLTYAGDFSFPGGMREPGDGDLYQTAERETFEELNLRPDVYEYVGELDDFMSKDGWLVRPFVVAMPKSVFETNHKKSDFEIEEIYFLPLSKLNNLRDEPLLHGITKRKPSYVYTDDNKFVWGLTATILVHIGNIIDGKRKPLGKKPEDK